MSWLGLSANQWHDAFWVILVGAVCNVSCAILGCYLVLRRLSLLGDAISHGILPGIAVAFLLTGSISSLPLFLGAMAIGVLTAMLTQTLHTFGKVPEDASMGVVFTSLFALGVILIKAFANNAHIDDCLFSGEILYALLDQTTMWGITIPRMLVPLLVALLATGLFVGLLWKELKIVAFDPMLATAMGINATLVHYLLMAMVAGVTVAAFEAVGAILVIAMLIVPPAAAHLLTDRLGPMMVASVVIGVLAAVGGYAGGVVWNTSVSGMTAVAAGALFAVVVLLAPRHGIVSKVVHNLALAMRIVGEDILATLYREEERGEQVAAADGGSWRDCIEAAGGGLPARLAVPMLWWQGRIAFSGARSLQLTQNGRRKARSLVRSHRLWEAYLGEHFELPLDHLHEPASRIEHYIGPDLQGKLQDELTRPDTDPHGQPIPDPLSRDE